MLSSRIHPLLGTLPGSPLPYEIDDVMEPILGDLGEARVGSLPPSLQDPTNAHVDDQIVDSGYGTADRKKHRQRLETLRGSTKPS